MRSSKIEYFVSAVNVVSSKPCIAPLPRIKIFYLLLSISTDELILTSKIMTFLPMLKSGNENSERESNPIPEPLYTHLPGSAFLVQSIQVKTASKSGDYVSNSQTT